MKPFEPPVCRLCENKHWARDGCDGKLQERAMGPAGNGGPMIPSTASKEAPAAERCPPAPGKPKPKTKRKTKPKKGHP